MPTTLVEEQQWYHLTFSEISNALTTIWKSITLATILKEKKLVCNLIDYKIILYSLIT